MEKEELIFGMSPDGYQSMLNIANIFNHKTVPEIGSVVPGNPIKTFPIFDRLGSRNCSRSNVIVLEGVSRTLPHLLSLDILPNFTFKDLISPSIVRVAIFAYYDDYAIVYTSKDALTYSGTFMSAEEGQKAETRAIKWLYDTGLSSGTKRATQFFTRDLYRYYSKIQKRLLSVLRTLAGKPELLETFNAHYNVDGVSKKRGSKIRLAAPNSLVTSSKILTLPVRSGYINFMYDDAMFCVFPTIKPIKVNRTRAPANLTTLQLNFYSSHKVLLFSGLYHSLLAPFKVSAFDTKTFHRNLLTKYTQPLKIIPEDGLIARPAPPGEFIDFVLSEANR